METTKSLVTWDFSIWKGKQLTIVEVTETHFICKAANSSLTARVPKAQAKVLLEIGNRVLVKCLGTSRHNQVGTITAIAPDEVGNRIFNGNEQLYTVKFDAEIEDLDCYTAWLHPAVDEPQPEAAEEPTPAPESSLSKADLEEIAANYIVKYHPQSVELYTVHKLVAGQRVAFKNCRLLHRASPPHRVNPTFVTPAGDRIYSSEWEVQGGKVDKAAAVVEDATPLVDEPQVCAASAEAIALADKLCELTTWEDVQKAVSEQEAFKKEAWDLLTKAQQTRITALKNDPILKVAQRVEIKGEGEGVIQKLPDRWGEYEVLFDDGRVLWFPESQIERVILTWGEMLAANEAAKAKEVAA